ncbi:unnamed protein product, partial [Effrenium voratum]
WMLALPLLDKARRESITPEESCYTAAIRALSFGGQPVQSLWLLNDVLSTNLQLRNQAFEAAIHACDQLGEWKRALAYLDYLAQSGLSADMGSTIQAMQACATCGQWFEALRLFDQMAPRASIGSTRPVRAFALSLEICEKTGQWQRAASLFDEFMAKGGILEEDLVEPLVRSCVHAGQVARVQTYFRDWAELGFIPSYALSRFVADSLWA